MNCPPLRLLWMAFFLVACAPPDLEPLPAAPAPVVSEAGRADLDAFLEDAVAAGRAPKVVAMAANAEGVIYQGAFGVQNGPEGVEVALDSIFNLASMTKPVTSVAVMMLAEAGAINLFDPIARYLPEWADREVATAVDREAGTIVTEPARSEITVGQLLSNTSGLAYNFSSRTMQDLIDVTGESEPLRLPLVAQPGAEWNYSGGTAVLGELITVVTGQPLDEFLRTRIFEPLGMLDTFYVVPAEKRARVVTAHRLENGVLVEGVGPETVQSPVRGDGGLYGTASDYIRFLRMLLNGGELEGVRLISGVTTAAMITNQIGDIFVETQFTTNPALSADFPFGAGRDKFGLGFQVAASNAANPDLRAAGSYSWGGIFNTHFWGDPQRGIVAVVLLQQLPFYGDDAMAVVQGFEERLNRSLN